jgi:hypothetical protein
MAVSQNVTTNVSTAAAISKNINTVGNNFWFIIVRPTSLDPPLPRVLDNRHA